VVEIHRNEREKLRSAALEEDDIVRIGEAEERFAFSDGFVVDGFEFLAAVADFSNAKAFALIVDKGGGGFFEHLGREHGRTGTEIEDAMRHCVNPSIRS